MRGFGSLSPFSGALGSGVVALALDMALANTFPARVARRGHAALLPKPEHMLGDGPCSYRATGSKRKARRNRAKGK